MNTAADTIGLPEVEAAIRDYRHARHDLLTAAYMAHFNGATKTELVRVLGGLPGFGRTKVLNLLAAHSASVAAHRAFVRADIHSAQVTTGSHVFDDERAAEHVYLYWLDDTPPDHETATRIALTLASTGLVVAATEADSVAAITSLDAVGRTLPLTRITPPATKRSRTPADEGPFYCVLNLIAIRDGHEVLVVEDPGDYGLPALPGTDIDPNGAFTIVAHARDAAAAIGLAVDPAQFYRVGIYQDPETDPRGHITNVTWAIAVPADIAAPVGLAWADIDALLASTMAFTHARLLADAYKSHRSGAFKVQA